MSRFIPRRAPKPALKNNQSEDEPERHAAQGPDAVVASLREARRVASTSVHMAYLCLFMWALPIETQGVLAPLYDMAADGDLPLEKLISENITRRTPTRAKTFYRRWQAVAKNLCTQYQMVNYVAAVFIGALATMLQDPLVSANHLARPLALMAFLCSLASLCYGVALYIYFSKIRPLPEILCRIERAGSTHRCRWWNFEIVLCLPAVWLLWSGLLFAISLMTSYVWGPNITLHSSTLPRVASVSIVAIWVVQMPLTVWTLARMGKPMHASQSPDASGAV